MGKKASRYRWLQRAWSRVGALWVLAASLSVGLVASAQRSESLIQFERDIAIVHPLGDDEAAWRRLENVLAPSIILPEFPVSESETLPTANPVFTAPGLKLDFDMALDALDEALRTGDLAIGDLDEFRLDLGQSSPALRALEQLNQKQFRAIVPTAVVAALVGSRAADLSQAVAACRDDPDCRERIDADFARRDAFVASFGKADLNNTCSAVAEKYLRHVNERCGNRACAAGHEKELREVLGPAFDRGCLRHPGSEPDHPEAGVRPPSSDATLMGRMLAATAFVTSTRTGFSEPFCTGLLIRRSDGVRLVTAHHCWKPAAILQDLHFGRIRVASLTDPDGESWPLEQPSVAVRRSLLETRNFNTDFIELRVIGGPADLPVVKPAPAQRYVDVVIPGFFRHHDRARAPAELGPIGKGLRVSNVGLCKVFDISDACVRVTCQTVGGFSGAPIFANRTESDGSLIVHGILSGGEGGADACGGPTLMPLNAGPAKPFTLEPIQ